MCYNALWNDIQIYVYVSICISVYEYGESVVTCAVSSRFNFVVYSAIVPYIPYTACTTYTTIANLQYNTHTHRQNFSQYALNVNSNLFEFRYLYTIVFLAKVPMKMHFSREKNFAKNPWTLAKSRLRQLFYYILYMLCSNNCRGTQVSTINPYRSPPLIEPQRGQFIAHIVRK